MSAQKLTSHKTDQFSGTARIPGDKSISHRAVMLGGLAKGETIISGLLESDDVLCTAHAMRQMGAKIITGDGLWRIHGVDGKLMQPAKPLDMGNSGTSTRLLMGLVAGHEITATFIGDPSLSKRPMKRVLEPLSHMGVEILEQQDGRLPVTLKGRYPLKPIEYTLPVASAQVKSALILAALSADGQSTIIEPRQTRDYTETMLQAFGADMVINKGQNEAKTGHSIQIKGGQRLFGCAIDVPADPSSAAFAAVAASLIDGANLTLPQIGMNPTRTGLYDTLLEMGADITIKNRRKAGGEIIADLVIKGHGSNHLKGVEVPAARVPFMIDEFPILAVAASCADGITKMTGLAELRVKESDRLAMMAKGLAACGVKLEEGKDSLIIHGTGRPPQGGALIETALDHRIAMSFLILGMVSDEPVTIDDSAPIKTSFPDFIPLMMECGAQFA